MQYIASYKTSQQISPDDWETVTRVLSVDPHATINQIAEWYCKNERITGDRRKNVKISFQITEVDNP